jgi:hypothetical protein
MVIFYDVDQIRSYVSQGFKYLIYNNSDSNFRLTLLSRSSFKGLRFINDMSSNAIKYNAVSVVIGHLLSKSEDLTDSVYNNREKNGIGEAARTVDIRCNGSSCLVSTSDSSFTSKGPRTLRTDTGRSAESDYEGKTPSYR